MRTRLKENKMKRILGIMGSPRKGGNTDVLMAALAEGARETMGAFERLPLKDGLIKECDGCHVCWTGKPCSKKDAMNDIFPKIAAAHAVVFGTPVYWYGPTALMKAFIDRFVYFNCPENRGGVGGKAAALLIPYEEETPDTAAPVVDFFERSLGYLEMRLVGQVIAPGVTKRGEVKKKPAFLEAARELGRRLAT
jgi:multimeric flavodoxin WrbA